MENSSPTLLSFRARLVAIAFLRRLCSFSFGTVFDRILQKSVETTLAVDRVGRIISNYELNHTGPRIRSLSLVCLVLGEVIISPLDSEGITIDANRQQRIPQRGLVSVHA